MLTSNVGFKPQHQMKTKAQKPCKLPKCKYFKTKYKHGGGFFDAMMPKKIIIIANIRNAFICSTQLESNDFVHNNPLFYSQQMHVSHFNFGRDTFN